MISLNRTDLERAHPILQSLDHHLAVDCIFAGSVPAQVYVDDLECPQAALAVASRRLFLAGDPKKQAINRRLQQLFDETLFPQALAAGEEMFVLYYQPDSWAEALDQILKDRYPIHSQRQVYIFKELKNDWRSMLPLGFSLRFADRELVNDPKIKNPGFLTEEMCSERESVEDFLDKSFGICLMHEDEIVGWCLSEYNFETGCEIGIAISQPFQRRGFATLIASAFIEEAASRGVIDIGWHCYTSNTPSVATALKIGFEKTADYPISLTWYKKADALAVNGDVCFNHQQYAEALIWFERAFQSGQSQGWAFWVAACAAALLEKQGNAFTYLEQAIEKGFADLQRIRTSPHLKSLHSSQEWQHRFPGL